MPLRQNPTAVGGTGEAGMVTFQDQFGQERWDCVMLDPGASAFLMGYGPFRRYVHMLEECGFPKEHLKFVKCDRKFFFGGDACSQCRWTVMLPVAVSGRCGFIQGYILPGETPMLMGRPIMEAIGLILDCKRHRVRLDDEPWQDLIVGLHGEYLMPLLDFENHDVEESPHFELVVPGDGGVTGDPVQFIDFNVAEQIFMDEHMAPVETYADEGEQKLRRHHLTTFETQLNHIEKEQQAYVTSELHGLHEPKPRVLWEVYCGGARLSKVAQSMGMMVEEFSYSTGWDFDLREHQNQFLQRLRAEMPDELFLAPECKLWSQMQNITARTEEQQVELQQQRQEHHDTHLQFVAMAYKEQVDGARHAHIEQPERALSWKTVALRDLPGFYVSFDQCMYGCCCLDYDDHWRLVKKGTGLRTTKAAMAAAMNLRCDGQHAHCRLEGSAPGYGRRTAYLEDYQPGLASTLAAAIYALNYLNAGSMPQRWMNNELCKGS